MKEQGKRELPYRLENLTIPELEALLQQDFIALGGDAPDVDYIMQIVEVIQKKEKETPGYQPVDTKDAWREFKEFYNTPEGREYSLYASEKEQPNAETRSTPEAASKKKVRRLRWYYMAAALLALLVSLTCIPVHGHPNIIQMVAHWSAETFTFMRSDSIDDTADDAPNSGVLYDTLEQALVQHKITKPVVPARCMDGFELVELKIREYEASRKIEFFAHYENEAQSISITVIRHASDKSQNLEINRDQEPTVYISNGIEHYIFQNLEMTTIAWNNESLECLISGTLPYAQIEEMIDSIYERQ